LQRPDRVGYSLVLRSSSPSTATGNHIEMAKGDYLTPHQKGIVRRYYEHKDALMHQKLAEIVSDLYVCADPKKAARLWKSAHTALKNVDAPAALVEHLVADQDLGGLADLVGKLF
jgi:hypothetical protein